MKGIKCFGLLLVFSIIFGLSLNASSDVNALKYAYDAFPLFTDIYTDINSSDSGYSATMGSRFQIVFDSDHSLSYEPDYMSNLNIFKLCDDPSLADPRIITSSFNSSRSQAALLSGQSFHKYAFNANNVCSSYLSQKGAYWWSFDSIFSAKYNLTTGDTTELVDLSNAFFDSGQDFYSAGSIKEMIIPLSLDSDRFDHITANTELEWDFGLVQKSANNFPYLSDNFISQLYLEYFDTDPSVSLVNTKHTDTVSCSIDKNFRFKTYGEDLWQDFLGFNVHCSWTPTTDIYNLYPTINIAGDDSVNPPVFLSYDYSGIYFTGTYFITNGDDTWSGEYANARPTGESIDSSPGYFQLYGEPNMGIDGCAFGDFECQLSNLFNFNITLNPFAPIFNLFTDQNSCAQIPTLAGMLHSNETQVCPWFDSTTRNIVTPVLGLSSMMLLFGFVVRWLGARSGNFIEDSGEGFDSGGLHFQNKFRRGK